MSLLGWLASLGTSRDEQCIVVEPKTQLVEPFELSTEERTIRDEWCALMDTDRYKYERLKELPKHFKIGSVVFLWDTRKVREWLGWCDDDDTRTEHLDIISYIGGRPELNNGGCTIECITREERVITPMGSATKIGVSARQYFKISNPDLYNYILNNLDKVVAQC